MTQLSERWSITPRYIQNLCRAGRLPGAVRFGRLWMLPEDVQRPADRRHKDVAETQEASALPEEICWSVLGAAYHMPGTEAELLKSLCAYPEAAELTKAQFAYLHGDIHDSDVLSKKLFDSSESFEIRIGAAFLMGICALYRGDVDDWLNTRSLIQKMPCPDNDCRARKELWLAVYGASIYDMSAYPDWFCRGCFDSLPIGYYPAARVHYIKYIYIRGDAMVKNQPLDSKDFNGQLFLLPAICEPLISQTAREKAIIPEIYMRLICASSYHHAGNDDLAIAHIDRALALALPDRIYAPFAEQRFNLDSLIDERMKRLDTGAFAEMKALYNRLIGGWATVHNTILHRSHTNELTAKELEAARLAVFGLTNLEIAARMGISINSVKTYLQAAKDKTGVKKRSELAAFV